MEPVLVMSGFGNHVLPRVAFGAPKPSLSLSPYALPLLNRSDVPLPELSLQLPLNVRSVSNANYREELSAKAHFAKVFPLDAHAHARKHTRAHTQTHTHTH
eukprot:1157435-Pelagomonas_calceolata.AAC.3